MSTCSEFSSLVNYDPWVVPHQLLPSITTVIGIEWNIIFLIVYVWETLEVVFLNCLKVSEAELPENSLISDPIQALAGVFVAKIMMNVIGMDKPLYSGIKAFYWGALFILPGIPLIIGGEYVWFYLPSWLVAMFILHKFGSPLSIYLVVSFVVYATLLSLSVFILEKEFNSFYTALLIATLMVFLLVFSKQTII